MPPGISPQRHNTERFFDFCGIHDYRIVHALCAPQTQINKISYHNIHKNLLLIVNIITYTVALPKGGFEIHNLTLACVLYHYVCRALQAMINSMFVTSLANDPPSPNDMSL